MRLVAALFGCALAACASAAQLTVALRTAQGAAVRDAVVWVEGATARPNGAPVEIGQRDQEFDPFVTVVSTGSRVVFPNRDKVKHHVYSFSAAKSFEIQLYSGLPAEPITFERSGVVVIGCNIHDWMTAYIAVVDSPWFAKSDAGGHGTLANLPPGRYVLHVWHPFQTAQMAPQTFELAAAPATRDLKLTLDIVAPPSKPRPIGGDTY